ncbi:FAD-dependent monooxygenase [Chitinophagaceae bacterium LWZ2-11]
MKVLIAGAGIGGLTTAIALKRKGIAYEVFEAADELKSVGAGIWLGPNAMGMYRKLGIADKIQAVSTCLQKVYIKDYKGSVLQTIDNRVIYNKYGTTSQSIHRAVLQKLLAEEAGLQHIHLGKRCVSVKEDATGGVTVSFSDGTEASGDLLVGADGLRSVIREQYVTNVAYRYSGQTCWRAIVNLTLPENEKYESAEVWGYKAGLRASYSQSSNNEVYFWYTKAMQSGVKLTNEEALDMIKKDLQPFSGKMNMVVDKIHADKLICNELTDFKPIDKWYKGRVVLLGDAAHATTPNLGQGASQAIEDAYVLAGCLSAKKEIEDAIIYYQSLRLKRAKMIVNTSYQLAMITNFKSKFARACRNFLMKHSPEFISQKQLDALYNVEYPV